MTQEKTYRGNEIDVTYNVRRCIHAAECVRGLSAVFNTQARPWVQPDNASADRVANVVTRCPTGALHFERHDGGPAETVPTQNSILPTPDGPLYIRGDITLELNAGASGDNAREADAVEAIQETRLALCRCGASQNKPYCDNSHRMIGFEDAGEVMDNSASAPALPEHGPITIMGRRNGPLVVRGNMEVKSADGRSVMRTRRTLLCRCGGSANKPFCDGTHNVNGFSAE
ncbi:MAG: CDGSH iron-sulfur domain-containing protein [Anaerolineae bacterium]|nr:CDGSH iron-sulfur domain-containing protein [Anaerolineae bacterium]MCO5192796.1 CDGSH iron-sulfur domain-containing protein [Anaerolineae bacterium]